MSPASLGQILLSALRSRVFRRRHALISLIGLLPLFLTSVWGAAEEPGSGWPLELTERYLTSNFMEYREGRFHAGLDLKTNGRVGHAVLAVEDGWISRLRAAPDGYGRAAYLRGASGRIYVYAHLARFGDRLRTVVRQAQARHDAYRVDLALPAERLPVQRGEILGLSGQSGTGGPHLHFEVRDSGQRPLNPHGQGFTVPDTIAPRIELLRALPAEPAAQVGGGLLAWSIADARGLSGGLPLLEVKGAVAFSAVVSDRSDRHAHRLEPYMLVVTLDGREVYRSRNDSFAFAESSQMLLEWLVLDGVREHWLHRRAGNGLPERYGEMWSLRPGGLEPGQHRLELLAVDYAGNRAEVSWQLQVRGPGERNTRKSEQVAAGGWCPDPIRLQLPESASGRARWLTPFLLVTAEADHIETAVAALAAGIEQPHTGGLADTVAGKQRADCFRFPAERGGALLAESVLWSLPDSLAGTEAERCQREQGLRYLARAKRFVSADWPAARAVTVAWPAPPDSGWSANDVAVYRQSSDGAWQWQGRLRGAGGPAGDSRPVFALGRPGRYALLRDEEPPRLGSTEQHLRVEERMERESQGVTLSRWEEMVVPAFDRGSGLDADSWRVHCDGVPLLAEPDPPRHRLLIELPDDLPPGEHLLELSVVDRAGLRTELRLTFLCTLRNRGQAAVRSP